MNLKYWFVKEVKDGICQSLQNSLNFTVKETSDLGIDHCLQVIAKMDHVIKAAEQVRDKATAAMYYQAGAQDAR